ncbi:MAG: hypothetical protein IJD59_02955, partial [Clostridia bacterium]|nr:hypothetical protein [Clostridia bacterium]
TPKKRLFFRITALIFLKYISYFCKKSACSTKKFLTFGHIAIFQTSPKQSLPKAHHQTETEGKQDRAHRLKEKRTDKKVFRQRPDTAQIDIADRLHEKLSFIQIHLFFPLSNRCAIRLTF